MDARFELFLRLISVFDAGFDYTAAYDSVPHQYGDETLYQSEMHLLKEIGRAQEITVTELAASLKKTKSACSQMVHKLQSKGLLQQERNPKNLREYKLTLTPRGQQIFDAHARFERNCLRRSCRCLDDFSDAELETYIRVQEKLNEAFCKDVEDNQELYARVIDLDQNDRI